jgi:hypothetical protein
MTFSTRAYLRHSAINSIQHSDTQQTSIEFYYAQCHNYLNVMLSAVVLNVAMLDVVSPMN